MRVLVVICLMMIVVSATAQFRINPHASDSVFQKDLFMTQMNQRYFSHPWRRAITVPAILTAASLYTVTDNENISKFEVKEERDEHMPTFRHHADDYLQYAPIAAVYTLNALGVKGKHDLANRTALLIKSELIMVAITFPLKKIIAEPRPDTGHKNSFPSGHTAQAFAAATFMAKEYGHISKWYSVGAYTVATGIGAMRILNDRHWVCDVLAGAAVGILSTNVAYLTHQYKWGRKKHASQTMVVPSYDGQTGMVSVVHRFNSR